MSDPSIIIQRQILDLQMSMEVLRKSDVPPTYLPYAQRSLNALAATAAAGDFAQPWSAYFLVFSVSVFVATTNNGTNYWTIDLIEQPSGTVIATVNTSAATAATWTRLNDTSVTQPASTCASLTCSATKTLAPGNLFLIPSVAVLRTGN